jgi:hypothetical protein
MDAKLSKWLRWLEVIKGEVQDLVMTKCTFRDVHKLIKDNPQLHQPSSFYDYLSRTYVSHVVIGIRRQLKCDSQSISLAGLLEELVDTPEVFTRAYYVGLYKGSVVEHFANKDFDKFAIQGSPHIDPTLVAADLAQLRVASMRCEDFADKRVAHRDKREPKELPTYNEVDACIDVLDNLYVRYLLLFHASNMTSLLPEMQYDWKAIFRVPWISPTKTDIEDNPT